MTGLYFLFAGIMIIIIMILKTFRVPEIKKAEKHTAPLSVELKKKLNF